MATEYVKSVGCHYATNCLENEKCARKKVKSNIAHVHHYRNGCQKFVAAKCNDTYQSDLVKDTILWEFKEKISFNCLQTINLLNLTI